MTNCRPLCIIISVGGVEVLPLEVLPHKLPHTQRHTPHTQPRRCFYILHIETMETTNTPKTREELEALFQEFIKEVERVKNHYGHEGQKATLKRFEFAYSFDTQYETNAPLFSSYITYNGGHVERRTREAGEFDAFYVYCKALHDIAYAMGN